MNTNIRDVGAGDECQNQEGSRSNLSGLPSPPLDVGADHQLPAPSE
jgi:hypothetical protein